MLYWAPPFDWAAGVPCVKENDPIEGLPMIVIEPTVYQEESPIPLVRFVRTV